ncbi:hypothetical protein [Aurantimonas sp. Leaf443]|uniref:hypothetical protein n=1 Tax=Aurantimonas sp. Leaf443 TaxID=1736378 RepID=UPI000A6551E9|nr:hypothetical protein [Aurantimonas sp. Leaf443]
MSPEETPRAQDRAAREARAKSTLASRLLWFVAFWVLGVAALGAVAFLIRSAIL